MNENDELKERIIILETRLAFQDRALDELNSIVTKQQNQVDYLTKELRQVTQQLRALAVSKTTEPPPHY